MTYMWLARGFCLARFMTVVLLALTITAGRPIALVGAQSRVVLQFPSWQWGQPGYDEFFRAAIEAFQKQHPDVTIQPVPIPQESYDDQLIVRFSAKSAPEIMQWTLWDFHAFAKAGWLDPLDDLLRNTDIPKTWVPAFQRFTSVNGKQYGVMLSGASVALMYNKRMFDAAHLTVPKTPQEFVVAAKKLTIKDASGRVAQYGFSMVSKPVPEIYSYGIGRFVAGLGGGLMNNGRVEVKNNGALKEAIRIYKELLEYGAIPKGLGRIDARQFLWEGKAAMLLEGPWVMTSVMQLNPKLLPDIRVAGIPFPQQISDPSNGLSIAHDAKHKDLAWEFIKMVTSPAWMARYGELTGVVPARQGSISQQAYEKLPWIRQFAEIASVGRTSIPSGLEAFQNQLYKAFADDLSDTLFGNAPVDQSVARLQHDVEGFIRSSK